MEGQVKAYKRKFDRDLRHIKVLFMKKKNAMPREEWVNFIHETKACILENPEEFFNFRLPSKEVVHAAIEQVFEGFFIDQKIRDNQRSRVIKKEDDQSANSR